MDHFFSYSDDSPLSQYATSESTSNGNEYNNISAADISNHDQVMLASSNPKKRSGRKKFQETRHPIYRGVRRRKNDKWVCEVREPTNNTRIWLGTYPTAEMAARANDVAAIALRGRNACLNFADSAWRLPIPASSDTKDIQRAASLAAEAFRPPQHSSAAEACRPLQNDNADNNVMDTSLEEKPLVGLQGSEEVNYMDEETIYNMHEFMNSMAHGMMLPPPQCVKSDECYGDVDMEGELSLWSYSS